MDAFPFDGEYTLDIERTGLRLPRPYTKRLFPKRFHPGFALPCPFAGGMRHRWLRGFGHERFVYLYVYPVGGQLVENLELWPLEKRHSRLVDQWVFTFEEAIEPAKSMHSGLLCILVGAFGDMQAEVLLSVIKPVDKAHFFVQAKDSVQREDCILVAVRD